MAVDLHDLFARDARRLHATHDRAARIVENQLRKACGLACLFEAGADVF